MIGKVRESCEYQDRAGIASTRNAESLPFASAPFLSDHLTSVALQSYAAVLWFTPLPPIKEEDRQPELLSHLCNISSIIENQQARRDVLQHMFRLVRKRFESISDRSSAQELYQSCEITWAKLLEEEVLRVEGLEKKEDQGREGGDVGEGGVQALWLTSTKMTEAQDRFLGQS